MTHLRRLAAVLATVSLAAGTSVGPVFAAETGIPEDGSGAAIDANPDGYAGLDGVAGLFEEQSESSLADTAAEALDDAAEGAEVAGEAAHVAKEVGEKFANAAFDSLFDFGMDRLLNFLFIDPIEKDLKDLTNEVTADFAQTLSELNSIETGLKGLSQTISTSDANAAKGTCSTLMSTADGYVTTINDAYDNYQEVLTPTWQQNNLTSTGGVQDMNAIGNAVFNGVPGSGSPSFIDGLDDVYQASESLMNLMTSQGGSASSGLVASCGESIASSILTGLNPGTGYPEPLEVGLAETAYFGQLQTIVAYYTGWANVGRALSTSGGKLALGVTMSPAPTTGQAVTSLCYGAQPSGSVNMLSCGGIVQFNDNMNTSYNSAWQATGASWAQATNGLMGTALGYSDSDSFSNGNVAWVTDIAVANQTNGKTVTSTSNPQYGNVNSNGLPMVNNTLISQDGLTALSKQGVGAKNVATSNAPAAGMSNVFVNANGFQQAGLTSAQVVSQLGLGVKANLLTPATSSHWNALLNNDNALLADNNNDCFVNASGDITSCLSNYSIAQLIGATGLMNAGQNSFDNLIIYTGEAGAWNMNQTETGISTPEGDYNNAVSVLSFLDTNIVPNEGYSVVFNDPSAANGTMTTNTIFPFASQGDYVFLGPTVAMANNKPIQGPSFTQIPSQGSSNSFGNGSYLCSVGPSNWSPMLLTYILGSYDNPYSGLPLANGETLSLSCGSAGKPAGWGGSAGTMPFTANSDFYTSPQTVMSFDGLAAVPCGSPGAQITCDNSGFTAVPGFFLNATQSSNLGGGADWTGSLNAFTPDTQYAWPVIDLNPSTTPCKLTNFSQGVNADGGIGLGVPQMCADLFAEYSAIAWGVDTGDVATFIEPNTNNNGNYQVTINMANNSSNAISGDLSISFTGVRAKGVSFTTSTKGASVNSGACQAGYSPYFEGNAGAGNMMNCPVTIPAGGAQFIASIPTSSLNGKPSVLAQPTAVLFANGPGTQVAGSVKTLTTNSVEPPLPPAPVSALNATATQDNKSVVLSWTVPAALESDYPITSYTVTGNLTGVSKTYTQSIALSDVTVNSNNTATATVPLPAAGAWTISLAAVNANGAGPADTVQVALGQGVPPAPQNLTVVEQPNSGVELLWTPAVAYPTVDSYIVQPVSPAGKAGQKISVKQANLLLPPPSSTGTWTYKVYAINSMGNSPVSTATINIQGGVPNQVSNLVATVDPFGRLNVTFTGSPDTVPSPSSYTVAVYKPGDYTTPVTQEVLPAAGAVNSYSVAGIYQFGKNSPTGSYVVVVYPTNQLGNGPIAYSPVYVTSGFTKSLGQLADLAQELNGIPVILNDLERAACASGKAKNANYLTGTCSEGKWTPNGSVAIGAGSVTQTGCDGSGACSPVTGSVVGSTATLNIVQNSEQNGTTLNIVDLSNNSAMVWSSNGQQIPYGQQVTAVIQNLSPGTHNMKLYTGVTDTLFTVTVS